MIAIIAPARLASTRFPEKLLHEIKGKALILWVAERLADQVPEIPRYFAVDHPRLRDILESAGFSTIITRSDHTCGTDRLAEANERIGADLIINVQGDEPLVTRGQIKALEARLQNGSDMATLATPFEKWTDFLDPNQVKVGAAAPAKFLGNDRGSPTHLADFLPKRVVVVCVALQHCAHCRRRTVLCQETAGLLAQQLLLFRKLKVHIPLLDLSPPKI